MGKSTSRNYHVGGICFSVELCSPYSFMEYSLSVKERISRSATGEPSDAVPVRAGDHVPARTLITTKDELTPGSDKWSFDMSQYEPFYVENPSSVDFHLKVTAPVPDPGSDGLEMLINVNDNEPNFTIYSDGPDSVFRFCGFDGSVVAVLHLSADSSEAVFQPVMRDGKVLSSSALYYYLTTSLMLVFTYQAALHDTLLVHSSVVCHDGEANMFLGKSGTGKSTHSRLWLDNIPDTELLNDDNPVLAFRDGSLFVFGSPWSGKTPCYRNVSRKVRAIVMLEQAPVNQIVQVQGLSAYSFLFSSVSSVRWNRKIMDHITSTLSNIAMSVPCYKMGCLPDADAALTCCRTIER